MRSESPMWVLRLMGPTPEHWDLSTEPGQRAVQRAAADAGLAAGLPGGVEVTAEPGGNFEVVMVLIKDGEGDLPTAESAADAAEAEARVRLGISPTTSEIGRLA